MKVITTQHNRIQYQRFVDTDYQALLEIKRQSEARALSVDPIISINNCQPLWLLTVKKISI